MVEVLLPCDGCNTIKSTKENYLSQNLVSLGKIRSWKLQV
jgi:hypothetical protein